MRQSERYFAEEAGDWVRCFPIYFPSVTEIFDVHGERGIGRAYVAM